MSFKQKIWSVSTTVPAAFADTIGETFGDDAVAVTILAPPRKPLAQIEALYTFPPDMPALMARLSVAAMLKGIKPPKPTLKQMPKLDWLKKVAEDFPPLSIARWTIHGAQHRSKVPNRRLALQIDATNAFGTGEHPTTRGCLMMLDWMLKKNLIRHPRVGRSPVWLKGNGVSIFPGMTVKALDMGCGSGILAMAFAKAARGTAVAVDLDPDSVSIAKNNAVSNGLAHNIRCGISYGYRSGLVKDGAPYDLIMSNIFAAPLSHMANDLKKHLRPGGMVILAGLLNHQANRVIAAHRMQKLHVIKRLIIGEWTILALKRRQRA